MCLLSRTWGAEKGRDWPGQPMGKNSRRERVRQKCDVEVEKRGEMGNEKNTKRAGKKKEANARFHAPKQTHGGSLPLFNVNIQNTQKAIQLDICTCILLTYACKSS